MEEAVGTPPLEDQAEPDTIDRITLIARDHADAAINVLIACIRDDGAMYADKLKAAQHILEVAGCLSL